MQATVTTAHVSADDGTRLALHVHGEGEPLLCLPGGPMLDSAYFLDLGGLAEHRAFARLDLRGTGESGVPADPASYRCDRQVADVEAGRRPRRLPAPPAGRRPAGRPAATSASTGSTWWATPPARTWPTGTPSSTR